MKKVVEIPVLARVEGHGSLLVEVNVKDKQVDRVEFRINEGARMFEAMLIGRKAEEVPLIASRICGICGPVHAICAARSLEEAMGVEVPDNINTVREIIAELNIVESHLLHVLVLSLPDFLGYNSILELPSDLKSKVFEVLRVRELIGKCLDVLCGERVHPKNIVPGGFSKLPVKSDLIDLASKLEKEVKKIRELIELVGDKMIIEFDRSSHYVALYDGKSYPITYGDLMLDSLLQIPHYAFKKYFSEVVVPYSTSKKSLIYGMESYMVGALARVNTNLKFLDSEARELIEKLGVKSPTTNPYLIPLAQLIESIHLIKNITRLVDEAKLTPHRIQYKPRHGMGSYVVEAPRGILYHHYVVNGKGKVLYADIITPTAQNIADVEDSIKTIISHEIRREENINRLERLCENIVRCYDPCISCSVHLIMMK